MATYFIDLVSGSDAAAGTSWGTAWRTFANGPTAARIAPGDEIRVSKSPDPTSLGNATWTNQKVGNSVTFATAPTQQIDPCKAGWVTMGAGSTVTNGQTTAYITPVTWGSTTVGALQWATSASANGAYKDLGSTINFSGNQQISFWFRTTSALDCTGAQNLLVDLCSDATATTVVTALTAPKWSYAANMWYPIVIDFGSALSSTVRSVRIRTTNATSQTFFIDEMFASPAGGLTLWSLVGRDNDWFQVKTVRGADLQLFFVYTPGTAAGAVQTATTQFDAAWVGTTSTVETFKRETYKAYGSAGPAAITGVVFNEAGSTTLPNQYLFGWNTSTGLRDGETFIDNLTHIATSAGINNTNGGNWRVDRLGLVRWASNAVSTGPFAFTNLALIGVSGFAFIGAGPATKQLLDNLGIAGCSFSTITGCSGTITFNGTSNSGGTNGATHTFGNVIGNQGSLSFGSIFGQTVNVGTLGIPGNTSGSYLALNSDGSHVTLGNVRLMNSAGPASTVALFASSAIRSSSVKIGTVDLLTSNGQPGGPATVTDSVIYIESYTAPNAPMLAATGAYGGSTVVLPSISGQPITAPSAGSSVPTNSKISFHNYNSSGNFRCYVLDNALPGAQSYFDLDAVDVFTPGSKSVRLTGSLYTAAGFTRARLDLKLASAAAEAGKLVTVTCRVKRANTSFDAGIYIPGATMLLPGYTTDQSAQCSSTGTWELLTVTFTPTANCVFDVMAWYKPTSAGTPTAVWDALTITQAP